MSAANKWDVEWKTRGEISYPQATICLYYFVYHTNTVALYWQEKSTLLMIENKRIDNPRIKIVKCVSAKTQDEKCVETLQKQTRSVIFNIHIYCIGPHRQMKSDEKNFRYTVKIGLWQIFQFSIFAPRREKCHYQGHRIRNFRFFSPYLYSIEMIKMNVSRPLKTFMCIKKIEYTIVCNTSDKEALTEWISWLHILTYGTQICLITNWVPAARDCLAYFCIHKITLAWRCHPILACNKEFYRPSLSLSSWVLREGVPRWRTYNEEWAWLFKLDWTFW